MPARKSHTAVIFRRGPPSEGSNCSGEAWQSLQLLPLRFWQLRRHQRVFVLKQRSRGWSAAVKYGFDISLHRTEPGTHRRAAAGLSVHKSPLREVSTSCTGPMTMSDREEVWRIVKRGEF